jgi:hypothetical protein
MDNHTSHDSSSSRAGPWPTLAYFRYGRDASTAALLVRWMRGRTAESTCSCWRPSSPPAGRRTPSAAWHTRARPILPHGQRTCRIALLALRFVTNIGVGFAVVVAPVYAAEVALASSWGLFLSLVDVFITDEILLGFISNHYALARPAAAPKLARRVRPRCPATAAPPPRGARHVGVAPVARLVRA